MVLIIGGAYQGKLDYAKEEYGLTDEDVFTCEEGSTAVGFDEKIVDHFERYVLALIKAGQVPEKAVGMQLRANRYKGRIIICDDISQGVVPMDVTERAWREGVGRTMVKVAQQADKVVRVFCGIPVVLKDEAAEGEPKAKTDGLDAVFAAEANGAVKDSGAKPSAAEVNGAVIDSGTKSFAAEANGAVKDSGAKPSAAEVSQAAHENMPHGIGGRMNNAQSGGLFSRGNQAVQGRQDGQGQAQKTQVAMQSATPFEHFDFGNAEEGGLTPEEQFRINFEKMKAERAAAKKKK